MRNLTHAAFGLAALLFLGCSSTDDPAPAAGSGKIQGAIGGKPFETVAASYNIGESDDPDNTIVVYVFDRAIQCAELGEAGWDTKITNGTQALEMKLIGKQPGTYPAKGTPNPGTGEASVNYTLSATTGTPSEISSTGGTVKLDTAAAEGGATGSFDLTFPDGNVSGSFSANWCAHGHEP